MTSLARNRKFKRVATVLSVFVAGIIGISALYLILLRHPGLFFHYSFAQDGITLHSDQPIPGGSAAQVLRDVAERLSRSPLFPEDPRWHAHVYICNHNWRFILFANIRYKVGGLAYPPLSNNIFLRAAHIDANRLVGPSGQEVPGERTLAYFIAHEITHTLIADELGSARYWSVPAWKNEGYADHVAKGPDFHYQRALDRYRSGEREMDPIKSGLYLRYQLLVDFLLERRGKSVHELLYEEFEPARLEAELGKAGPLR
jgi:hypothetical protein